ncbi:MAG TPA: hypothetical protein VMZ30_07590 [Pyrinomonadaceae bacterium]|nr:hypothetical protein [Pyrinomonadaceae bacterium]
MKFLRNIFNRLAFIEHLSESDTTTQLWDEKILVFIATVNNILSPVRMRAAAES